MATIKTAIDRVSGDTSALELLISVWNDDLTELDYQDALDAALLVAPASIIGCYPTGSPTFKEESRAIHKFGIKYQSPEKSDRQPAPIPEVGSLVRRPNFQAKAKTLKNFLAPIGVYDKTGEVTSKYPKEKWFIDLSGQGHQYYQEAKGTEFQPLSAVNAMTLYVPNVDVDDTYFDAILALCAKGCFNDDDFFGKPAGSVQLVSFSAQERNANAWEFEFGFGYQEEETDFAVDDDIAIPTLRGCDYYWTKSRTTFDDVEHIMQDEVWLAFVGQVWPLGDFSQLGLP